tara:strand:+ start:86 stop:1117 length:1032 start_codon:yes stop_codon:yes gene_type:complete
MIESNSTWPIVSVVIPHYGGYETLLECISSLQNCDYSNLEIIVVDNCSQDKSAQLVKIEYPKIKLIESDYNRGFAGGCNYGAKFAKGEYLLILNNDTIHEPNWINILVDFMQLNHSVSSVQPKIRNYDNQNYFDYAGGSGGFIDKYCFPYSRGRIFSTIEKDIGQYDSPCKIFWASGTAFLTRKNIFMQVNGFDEVLFAHMEEIDYHWKCQYLGHEVWVQPNSVIYHKGATTLPISSPKKTYLNYRNSFILLLSNYSIIETFYLFFPRLIFECISILRELLSLNLGHAFAIIKSWFWIIKNINFICKKRKLINKIKIKKINLIDQNSIVIKYFIFKKKFFSQI